jgi:hypothetical protein
MGRETVGRNGNDTFWPERAEAYAAFTISRTARPSSPLVTGDVSCRTHAMKC